MGSVYSPDYYTKGGMETSDKIKTVIDGLSAYEAALLFNILKYFDRAGLKGDAQEDLLKANNYAHKLVKGAWRDK